jgi:hypothetical protein
MPRREVQGPDDSRIVVPVNWGFTQSTLEQLGGMAVRDFWYGFQNMRTLPHQVLDWCNRDEAAALYLGAAIMKLNDCHIFLESDMLHFSDLVQYINKQAYPSFPGDLAMLREGGGRFPHKRGDQRTRLAQLPDSVKDDFVDAWYEHYISPGWAGESNCFWDPGQGARNMSGAKGARVRELNRAFRRKY